MPYSTASPRPPARTIARLAAVAAVGVTAAVMATVNGASAGTASVQAPSRGILFGAHVNPRNGQTQLASIHTFEKEIGRKLDIANKYHGFSDHNYGVERSLLSGGETPLISWRATDNRNDPNRAAEIARGQYDSTVKATATAVKALRRPVLLQFQWEMDQPRGSRQYIGTPAQFVAAWRHIYSLFRSAGAANAAFVWSPRAGAFNHGAAASFYPGDAYVNWIGGSAVPNDSWPSFTGTFSRFYSWGRARHKPLLIWAGVQENRHAAGYKPGWMRSVGTTLPRWPAVKAFVYYHALSPLGYKFWADTTNASLSAYRAVGCTAYFAMSKRC
jgi:hypothetical protein